MCSSLSVPGRSFLLAKLFTSYFSKQGSVTKFYTCLLQKAFLHSPPHSVDYSLVSVLSIYKGNQPLMLLHKNTVFVLVGMLQNKSILGFFLKKTSFIFRERERKGECEGEISIGCLSHVPKWGPGLQHRHVPWPGIESVAFRFAGLCSTHRTTLIRADVLHIDYTIRVWMPCK